jgi:hypothetical protein
MHPENPAAAEVEAWLTTLGVETVCQWDVLVFLYRHPTSLVGADHVARLLGYSTECVVAALDVLASLGLVTRSRVSQGARLYQFTAPPEPPRGGALDRLMALGEHRAGRLLLTGRLKRGDLPPREGPEAAGDVLDEAGRFARAAAVRRGPWRKAI